MAKTSIRSGEANHDAEPVINTVNGDVMRIQ